MFNEIFKIDYNRLVALLLLPDLRKLKMVAWLQALVLPIKVLYQNFLINRSNNLYKLGHNGQICYLRKVLNDAFDPSLRRIYITDGIRYERTYIYTPVEAQPKYLGKIFIHHSSEFSDNGVDFRVIVPDDFDLANQHYQMKALINFYKLASKRYLIEKENG